MQARPGLKPPWFQKFNLLKGDHFQLDSFQCQSSCDPYTRSTMMHLSELPRRWRAPQRALRLAATQTGALRCRHRTAGSDRHWIHNRRAPLGHDGCSVEPRSPKDRLRAVPSPVRLQRLVQQVDSGVTSQVVEGESPCSYRSASSTLPQVHERGHARADAACAAPRGAVRRCRLTSSG